MARILIVEDEERIASFVSKGLAADGHRTTAVADGRVGLDHALSGEFDLMVLDIGLPGMGGFEVLDQPARRARSSRSSSSPRATRSRTRSPRSRAAPTTTCPSRSALPSCWPGSGSGSAPPPTRVAPRATTSSRPAAYASTCAPAAPPSESASCSSAREFALAETLMVNAGQVLSREQPLDQVWGFDFDPGSNVVDVYVGYLRKKFGPTAIATVRGMGYRFNN